MVGETFPQTLYIEADVTDKSFKSNPITTQGVYCIDLSTHKENGRHAVLKESFQVYDLCDLFSLSGQMILAYRLQSSSAQTQTLLL